jgi:hypothetical protein
MTQIGAVGGEFCRIGSKMLGPRHGKLDMCPLAGNTQAQVLLVGQGMPCYLCKLSLSLARWGAHTQFSIYIPKVPLFGASVDPLW